MSKPEDPDDCVSKKPWSEVLNRSLKMFTFNAASEGGKSIGKTVFFVILALIVLSALTLVLDSLTGWFSGWFDFWPFNREVAADEIAPEEGRRWFNFGKGEAEAPAAPAPEVDGDEPKWYCKFNPLC